MGHWSTEIHMSKDIYVRVRTVTVVDEHTTLTGNHIVIIPEK